MARARWSGPCCVPLLVLCSICRFAFSFNTTVRYAGRNPTALQRQSPRRDQDPVLSRCMWGPIFPKLQVGKLTPGHLQRHSDPIIPGIVVLIHGRFDDSHVGTFSRFCGIFPFDTLRIDMRGKCLRLPRSRIFEI
jgi:hypothetical protein